MAPCAAAYRVVGSSLPIGRETREGPVDVWWHSRKNGALMLIFAHLITRTPAWRDRPVRLLHTVATQDEHAAMLLALEELIATSRIAAQAVVLVGDDLAAGIRGQSGNSALVILGIDPIDGGTNEAWHADIQQMISGLPEVILISNAGDMRLGD